MKNKRCPIVIVSLLVFGGFLTGTNLMTENVSAQISWDIETVDIGGNVGLYTSIALDTSNNPHISYYDDTRHELKYAKWTGSDWNIETVDSGFVGMHTSIALDSMNNPHISYCANDNYALKHANWTGSAWNIETVPPPLGGGYVCLSTSMAIDSSGYPHITYYRFMLAFPLTWSLWYAKWNGSEWETESIDSKITDVEIGDFFTSIALDGSNYPHISYYDPTDCDLKYANWTGIAWNVEIIDSAGDVGKYSSISLDSSDYPHISYFDSANDALKYTKWTGGGWSIETVDSSSTAGQYTSIALDGSEYPGISYFDVNTSNLKYAKWTGGGWNIETVDSNGDVGKHTSMVFDSLNYPRISYYNATNGDLQYVRWNGAVWNMETVDTGYGFMNEGILGQFTSIALNNSNYPHISYYDWTNGDLKYAKMTGSMWEIETIDSIDDVGKYTSIAIDNSDNIHISYYNASGGNLKCASNFGGPWTTWTIDSDGNVGMYTSIAIGSGIIPHISYYDASGGNLKYSIGMSIETLDSSGNVGLYTSIAADNSNYPHISYYNASGEDLKYAKYTGSGWSIETVDSSGTVGQYTSIALDSNGYPHISYYGGGLKYAKWTGSDWSIETVDFGGNVGLYTSIALDSFDYPHISYYDDSNDDLKYARWTGNIWNIEMVDSIDYMGMYNSIALDDNNNPHISYYYEEPLSFRGNLKYATGTGTQPSAPAALIATPGDSQVTLTWTLPSSDGGYAIMNFNIYRGTTPGSETFLTQVGNILTYTDIGLTNGQKYYYQISALNNAGEGPRSNEASAIPITEPSKPQSLQASAGDSYINITWIAPSSDGGSAIIGYNIYRNGTVGIYDSVSASQLWYNDTNVNNGISYTYNVSAFNGVGEGPYSTISATPMTIPSAPQNLQVIIGDRWVDLTWNAPYDGGSPIIAYNIYRNGTVGVYDSIPASQQWYNDTNVINGVIYIYNVSGINGIGEGQNSTISAKPMTVPLAPQNLQANSGDSFVNLTWSVPSSDGGSAIIAYNIYRNGTVGVYATVPAVQLWHNDINVINGISYTYNVTALNVVGEGPNSIISATPMTVPSVPQNLQANSGDSYVNFTWNAPTSNGGSPITAYNIYRNGTLGVYTSVPANQLWFNDSNLINGLTYTYNVSAINGVDEGPYSTISATPMMTPSAPQNLQAICGDRYVNVTWNIPAYDGGSLIMNYAIYRGTTSDGEIFLTEIGNILYYNDTSVSNGITYYYKVGAKNAIGEGFLSNEVSATPVTVPLTPINFTATSGDGEVTLSWSIPSSDGGSAITTYRIYRGTSKDNLTFLVELGCDILTYTNTDLTNGITYFYKVSAVNAAGEGLASSEVSARPQLSVSQPTRGILEEFWWLFLLIVLFMIIAFIAMLYFYREKEMEEVKEDAGKFEEEVVTSEEAIERPKGKMPSSEIVEATKRIEAETQTPPTPKKVVKKPLEKVYQKRMVAKMSDKSETAKEDKED